MFKILIDTCVWLDMAKDVRQRPLLDALERLAQQHQIGLIVPAVVQEEFERNRTRIAEENSRSLSGVLRRVSEVVERFSDAKRRASVLKELRELDHRIPLVGESAHQSIARIRTLLAGGTIIQPTPAMKVRAAERALTAKAPCHRQRNSIADAIIIETYADVISARGSGLRYSFVTHNTKDFSHPSSDTRMPHPDIASLFSRVRSLYFTNLSRALRRVDPWVVSEFTLENDLSEAPRRLTEILDAMDVLWHQVWYNRHQNLRHRIEHGLTPIVKREHLAVKDRVNRPIQRDVWQLAQRAAKRVEKKYGHHNLGPWDDFEWGMINGKLSALRWVLGEEWDMLDT